MSDDPLDLMTKILDDWADNGLKVPEMLEINPKQAVEGHPNCISWTLLKDTTKFAYAMGLEGVFMVTEVQPNMFAIGHNVYLNERGVWTYDRRSRLELSHVDDHISRGNANLTRKYDDALADHRDAVYELRRNMARRRMEMMENKE